MNKVVKGHNDDEVVMGIPIITPPPLPAVDADAQENVAGDEPSRWERIMMTVLKMPGVRVDRKQFLQKALTGRAAPMAIAQAIETSPTAVLPMKVIDQVARRHISRHTLKATAVSTVTGVPGGWALAATIPADVLQYYYHVLVISQKLAYLYGFPDLCDTQHRFTEQGRQLLTIFGGVMIGATMANAALKEACERLSVQALRKLPELHLTQTIMKSIGMSITRERAMRGVTRAVPLVGGIVSGTMTYFSFRPAARRLQRTLKKYMK